MLYNACIRCAKCVQQVEKWSTMFDIISLWHTRTRICRTVKRGKMRTTCKSAHKQQCHVTPMCRCTKKHERNEVEPEYGDWEATRLSARKGSVSQQVTTVGRTMVQLTEPWRSRDEGGSWVSTIQPYQTWEFREMNVTLDQISCQCFARTNKVLLSTPLERIHTSTQLPDLNGAAASTRSLSADRMQLHKCKKGQFSSARAHAHQPQQIITRVGWAMFQQNYAPPSSAACSPELQLENYRKNEGFSAFPPRGAALMHNRAKDAGQAPWNKAAHNCNACKYCSLVQVQW